jgi:hypothetical protein
MESIVTELEVGCPSCGALLRTDENDTTIHCDHCGRDFLLTADGEAPSSYVPPRWTTDEAQARARSWLREEGHRATSVGQGRWLLVPYWRYRAKVFKWYAARRGSIRRTADSDDTNIFRDLMVRAFDFTLPASSFDTGLPCLGARDEILPARIMGPAVHDWAQLVDLAHDLDEARANARQRADSGTQPPGVQVQCERLTLLDEHLELLYFPFFVLDYQFRDKVRRVVVDGWNGTVCAHFDDLDELGDDAMPVPASRTAPLGKTAFLPARCPVCLTEIVPSRFDRVHRCTSCQRAWEVAGPVAREIRQLAIDNGIELDVAGAEEDGRLLPFWAIRAVISGWRIGAGDTPTTDAAGSGDHINVFVPAFETLHIERMSQLGIHLTRACPDFPSHPTATITTMTAVAANCAVSRVDAARMAWVILGAMASAEPAAFESFIEHGRVDIEDAHLLWIPFRTSGLYLREPITGALVRETSARPWDDVDLQAA